MVKQFLHVTKVDNVQNILKKGLRINSDSQIFVFTELKNAPMISNHQVDLFDKFALIGIERKGIVDWSITHDNVGELTAYDQFILMPKKKKLVLIMPEFLSFLGVYEVIRTNIDISKHDTEDKLIENIMNSFDSRRLNDYKI